MKQLIGFLFCTVLLHKIGDAQIGSIVNATEPIAGSEFYTYENTFDPGYANSFVFMLSHGATAFKQTHEIMLMDSKTLGVKQKIAFPSYDGYSYDMNYKKYVELKGNLVLVYKGKAKKGHTINAIKLNESFAVPEKPQYLFTMEDDFRDGSFLELTKNEKKDLCLFTYYVNDKKTKTAIYHYRVYDVNLKLLKNDSLVSDIKMADTINSIIYDKGVIITKNQGDNRLVGIIDVRANKTYTLQPSFPSNYMTLQNAKSIGNDKIVLFGRYFTLTRKARLKGGLFKIIYNTQTNRIESQIYMDKLPTASKDQEFWLTIDKSIITDAGACYALISQVVGGELDIITKYEMIYINTETDKWKRQVPLPGNGTRDLLLSNGDIVISYIERAGDDTKINYNDYTYEGNYKGRSKSSNSNAALIKISTKTSYVQQQSFPDLLFDHMMSYNNEFIGIKNVTGLGKSLLFKIKLDK